MPALHIAAAVAIYFNRWDEILFNNRSMDDPFVTLAFLVYCLGPGICVFIATAYFLIRGLDEVDAGLWVAAWALIPGLLVGSLAVVFLFLGFPLLLVADLVLCTIMAAVIFHDT